MAPLQFFLQRPLRNSALALFLLALAVVLAALGFQYIGGYKPCPLCYLERKAWYAALPVSLAALWLAGRAMKTPAVLLLALAALAFLANAGLAGYHAGVEWQWWEGPSTCSGDQLAPLATGQDFLSSLQNTTIVRCDKAQFRLFGLSFSGYNFLLSLLAALIALTGAFLGRKTAHNTREL